MSPILLSISYLLCILVWIAIYGWSGKSRKYARNRDEFEQNRRFESLSKLIFCGSNALLVYSFWSDADWLLKMWNSPLLHGAGVIIIVLATLLLVWAMATLGENYSPYFDSYKPFAIVTKGPYAVLRHPIYTANLTMAFGLCLMSGSLWAFLFAVASSIEMIRAMNREESFLDQSFPAYRSYRLTTKRLIPFIY